MSRWTRFAAGMRQFFCRHLENADMGSPTYCSKHDPEDQPSKAPDDNAGRRSALGQAGEGPEWAEEYPQETCFQEL